MADRILAASAPARRNETVPESLITNTTNHITEAGEHPERAEELVEDLGIGSDESAVLPELGAQMLDKVLAALRNPRKSRFTAYSSPIAQALHGDGMFYPPFCCYDDVEEIPEGAFNAGLERVIAVDAAMGDKELRPLRSQVERSYPLARYVNVLSDCITDVNDIDSAAWFMREIAAACFRAGWIQGGNAAEVAANEREARNLPQTKGTVEELADLLRRKILLGAIDDEALTSGGYWNREQVEKAFRIVRLEKNPEEYADYYALLDRGLTEAEAWEESGKMQATRAEAQPAPDFPECGAEDRDWQCTNPAGHEGPHVALAENSEGEEVIGHTWSEPTDSNHQAKIGGAR